MNSDERASDDFESRLRSRLRAVTTDITPGSDLAADINRAARRQQRTRRRVATGVAAAIVAFTSAVTFSATRAGDRRELVTPAAGSPSEFPTNPSVRAGDASNPPTNLSVPVPDSVAPASNSTTLDPGTNYTIVTSTAQNTLIVSFTADTCQMTSATKLDPATLTIQVLQTDAVTRRASLLGIPADLLVGVDQTTTIGSTFSINNPQLLVDQIYAMFQISLNHYVELNQCAVASLVDAVGGVAVPFANPIRDTQTGLDIPEPGCHTFTSSDIVPYLTSTDLETETTAGAWQTDPTGQRGRIYRQSDFLRRLLETGRVNGTLAPSNTPTVIAALEANIVTDHNLTATGVTDLLDLVVGVPAANFGTYDFPGTDEPGGYAVDLADPNGAAIRATFRGEPSPDGPPLQIDVGIVPNPSAYCTPTAAGGDPSEPSFSPPLPTSTTGPREAQTVIDTVAFGDSVMEGAEQPLQSAGITVQAVANMQGQSMIDLIRSTLAESDITNNVIIQVGTNGTVTQTEYDQLADLVAGVPHVYFLTLKAPKDWIAPNNARINALPATHPNVEVIDWATLAEQVAPDLSPGDGGIHLYDTTSINFYTDMILSAIGHPR